MLLAGLLPGTGLSHIRRELDERPAYIMHYLRLLSFFILGNKLRLASQIGSGEATLTQASSLGQIYGSTAFGLLGIYIYIPLVLGALMYC